MGRKSKVWRVILYVMKRALVLIVNTAKNEVMRRCGFYHISNCAAHQMYKLVTSVWTATLCPKFQKVSSLYFEAVGMVAWV